MSMVRKSYAEGRRKYKKRIIGARNENDVAQAAAEKAERDRLKLLAEKAKPRVVKIDPKAPGARRRWL
jgi:hypothetical protein